MTHFTPLQEARQRVYDLTHRGFSEDDVNAAIERLILEAKAEALREAAAKLESDRPDLRGINWNA